MKRSTFLKLLIGIPALLTTTPKENKPLHKGYMYEDKTEFLHWTDQEALEELTCKLENNIINNTLKSSRNICEKIYKRGNI